MTVEVRDASPDYWVATGPASKWAGKRPAYFVYSARVGMFLEQFERGAFDGAVNGDYCETRLEHDPAGPVFSRTSDGTLRFENTRGGLLLGSALSKHDGPTRDLVANIRSGDTAGLSVGFVNVRDSWSTGPDNRTALRTVHEAQLNEVSFVARPCNPQAGVDSVRHETRNRGVIEYRSWPLAYRAPFTYVQCPECGTKIPVTDDNLADDDDDDGDDRASGKYSAADVERLGRQGKAFKNPDGHYSFPIADRQDLLNAIHAIGRSGLADKAPLRRYIIARAKALGVSRMIPASWSAARSSLLDPNDTSELESEFWRICVGAG